MNGANEFVFYDGPPFANGLPHYGHLLTGYVKDVVPRYQTMRGQARRATLRLGLPRPARRVRGREAARHLAQERDRGDGRREVQRRLPHLRAALHDDWEAYVTRQARWVDFDHDYKTLDLSYMESVMWAFKTLWDKGLIYEGFRVLWYCWRCETPLSNTETKMDDVYRDRQDPAVTVGLRLQSDNPELRRRGGAGLDDDAVDAAVEPRGGRASGRRVRRRAGARTAKRYLLAEARVAAYARELGESPDGARDDSRASSSSARATRRRSTSSPASSLTRTRSCSADYVTTEDGTGMVHIAPAYGEEDKVVTDAAGIEPVTPVNSRGEFDAQVPPYEGMHVFEANKAIIKDLRASGALLRHDTYQHSYPHCWRCDNPLIQRAVSSWFVAVTKFRDRMVRAEQADPLGARAHPRRTVRQVAGERARLVDLAQPILGFADSGVGVGRSRSFRASTSTARSTSSSATSAFGRRTSTGRRSTS